MKKIHDWLMRDWANQFAIILPLILATLQEGLSPQPLPIYASITTIGIGFVVIRFAITVIRAVNEQY